MKTKHRKTRKAAHHGGHRRTSSVSKVRPAQPESQKGQTAEDEKLKENQERVEAEGETPTWEI
jgi:hypothetical protein